MMDLFYQLALMLVPNIGDAHARLLIEHLGDAASIFRARTDLLGRIDGIGEARALSIKSFQNFERAEAELRFIEDNRIKPLFIKDTAYPSRLLQCFDAPVLLFYKGTVDLNAPKVLSIVGTRKNTEHGRQAVETLVKELAEENIVIVSGLAYGIDALAHKTALANRLPTVGVVGHGLDLIYPYAHTMLAREIIREGGGILTEFFSGTKPDRHHFPLRNRIVAGISDATVVVETHVRGGSMITAKLADAYNRDVLAFPGRFFDKTSSGCNQLIKYNKAMLLTDADQLLDVLGWKKKEGPAKQVQRALFIDLTEEEKRIVELLQDRGTLHLNELQGSAGLSSSAIANAILNLEMQNLITSLPGNRYSLL